MSWWNLLGASKETGFITVETLHPLFALHSEGGAKMRTQKPTGLGLLPLTGHSACGSHSSRSG